MSARDYVLSNGFVVENPTFGYDAQTDALFTVTLGTLGGREYRGNPATGQVFSRPLNIPSMKGCQPSVYGDRVYWRQGLRAWLAQAELTEEGKNW